MSEQLFLAFSAFFLDMHKEKQAGDKCGMFTHLPVQSCRHCDDSSRFIVDGEHVGGRTLRVLRQNLVTQHPIRRSGVVFVNRRHGHHKRPCGRMQIILFHLYISFVLFRKEKDDESVGDLSGT